MTMRAPLLTLLALAACDAALPGADLGAPPDLSTADRESAPAFDFASTDAALRSDMVPPDLTAPSDLAGADIGPPHSCAPSGVCASAPQCGTNFCCNPGSWCDSSGAVPVCRCGDQVAASTSCCFGSDPNNPGCGNQYIPICE
jgi:hypothetical protein